MRPLYQYEDQSPPRKLMRPPGLVSDGGSSGSDLFGRRWPGPDAGLRVTPVLPLLSNAAIEHQDLLLDPLDVVVPLIGDLDGQYLSPGGILHDDSGYFDI